MTKCIHSDDYGKTFNMAYVYYVYHNILNNGYFLFQVSIIEMFYYQLSITVSHSYIEYIKLKYCGK